MAQNVRTPGAGTPRALENVCLAADSFQIAPKPLEIQKRRLLSCYKVSPAVAEAIAALAYGTLNQGGGA
jgi:hypothetical protein